MVAKTSGSHIARARKGTMEDAPAGTKSSPSSAAVVDEDDSPLIEKSGRTHKKTKNADTSDTTESVAKAAMSDEHQQPFVAIAPATAAAAAIKEIAAKRAKPDAPKFLIMLYEILQNESDKVIRWTDDGLALQILEQNNVTEKVLPKYFNHTNFHSFQRQLNYFGFRKWTKSKTDICTFSHPYFRRNQPELMHLIKRKKATRRANEPDQPDAAVEAQLAAAAGAVPKRLLPTSPTGKRHYPHDDGRPHANDAYQHAVSTGSFPSSNGNAMLGSSSGTSSSNNITLAPLTSAGKPFSTPTSAHTNAISPASGGAKKKAKTSNDSKAFPSEASPSNGMSSPDMSELSAIAAMNPQAFSKGTLPNLDLVRNRLIYRHPSQGGPTTTASTPVQPFPNAFNFNPSTGHAGAPTENTSRPPQSPATPGDSSSMFSNSFSDPVDILLRIKKSRAMSQDNTQLQSPQQRAHGQVDGIASLQNFLLTQSLYTNRLESQLKLALEENETLRQAVETKTREYDTLLNERKMIQNENAVLTEDKNKLFEINRDLLSKLFPQ